MRTRQLQVVGVALALCSCHELSRYSPGATSTVDAAASDQAAAVDQQTDSPGDTGVPEDLVPTSDDASALDAAAVQDAGADTGPALSVCDEGHPGVVLCDSFEDPLFFGWVVQAGSGTLVQDTQRVVFGGGSLMAKLAVVGTADMQLERPAIGPFSSGDLYLRTHIYLESAPASGHVVPLYLGENIPPWHHLGLEIAANSAELWLEQSAEYQPLTIPFPTGRWVCLQLHVKISDTAGELTLWLDNVLAAKATGFDTLPGAGYDVLEVGFPWSTSDASPTTAWFDEMVLSTQPILCP